ncbi:MAG: hypothetical protein PVI21_05040 [Candidatus Woesebacteria bacterium]|jgi:hypothetical protein
MISLFATDNKLRKMKVDELDRYYKRYLQLHKEWGWAFWAIAAVVLVSILEQTLNTYFLLLAQTLCILIESYYLFRTKKVGRILSEKNDNWRDNGS